MGVIKPQQGYQENALSSCADIVIGGGAAGSGKTFCLLMEFVRHINNPDWGGVIFRRTTPQIKNEGGLWDTSMKIYPTLADPKESIMQWNFSKGAKLKFSHLEYEKNKLDWQGSQIPFIGFDELTHFSESQFFYLLSRNRSACGVKPYVRTTCNPDPDSWVADFISWWINQETGLPIPDRDGIVRYFIKDGANYIWGDTLEDCYQKAKYLIDPMLEKAGDVIKKEDMIKSATFIHGDIFHNKELLKVNPAYLANLMSQGDEEKAQLLEGNWKVKLSGLELYNHIKWKDIWHNEFVEGGDRVITADIAMKGSDLFVIMVWDGFRLIDCQWFNKTDGKQVIDYIKEAQMKYKIPNSSVIFDGDGVGSFIDGFIQGSSSFNNGASPIDVDFKKQNYQNLKTQCYYLSAERVNNSGVYISEDLAGKMIDGLTLQSRMAKEQRVIKSHKTDHDGKLRILPKDQQKSLLGWSPDFMDCFMMREYYELIKANQSVFGIFGDNGQLIS